MASPRSGFRKDSYKSIIVGPGAVVLNYGLPGERLLGATRGGNQFNPGITYRDIEADKAYGMVKGLRLIDDIQPQIVSNLLELSSENLKVAIPGLRTVANTTSTEVVNAEYVDEGDAVVTVFELANGDVVKSTVKVYVDSVLADPSTYTVRNSGDDNYVGPVGADLVFDTAPANGEVITVSYTYDTGNPSTHEILRLSEVEESDYIENVAILGTAMGYDRPFIGIIRNVLAEGGIEISLENKNEGVVEVTFTGMFTGEGLEMLALGTAELDEVAPFEIRWPNS